MDLAITIFHGLSAGFTGLAIGRYLCGYRWQRQPRPPNDEPQDIEVARRFWDGR